MTGAVIIALIKFLLSSALMTGFYFLLFKNKSSLTAGRLFLLFIPVACLFFSLFTFETGLLGKNLFSWPPVIRTFGQVTTDLPKKVPPSAATGRAIPAAVSERQAYPTDGTGITAPYDPAPLPDVSGGTPATPNAGQRNGMKINAAAILLAVYAAVSSGYLFLMVRHLRRIYLIKKSTAAECADGCRLLRSGMVKSPFSIFNEIYVNDKCRGEQLMIIVAHERQHILCRHYIDLIIIELFLLVFWFNPFIWVIRKEVRALHEFQVDACLLKGGMRRERYMRTILAEKIAVTPTFANGFNGPLIKQRFLRMRDGNEVKLRALRMSVTLPFVFAMLMLFSSRTPCRSIHTAIQSGKAYVLPAKYFREPDVAPYGFPKTAANRTKEVILPSGSGYSGRTAEVRAAREAAHLDAYGTLSGTGGGNVAVAETAPHSSYAEAAATTVTFPAIAPLSDEEIADITKDMIAKVYGASRYDESIMYNPDGVEVPESIAKDIRAYNGIMVSGEELRIFEGQFRRDVRHPGIINLETTGNETVVTVVSRINNQWDWLFWDAETCLIDRKTGDRYMIRDVEGAVGLGQMAFIYGFQDKYIEQTLIFPPLKEGVEIVDIYEPSNYIDLPTANNNNGFHWMDVEIADYASVSQFDLGGNGGQLYVFRNP